MTHAFILIGGFGFVGRNIISAVNENIAFEALTPVIIDDLSNACPGHESLELLSYVGAYQSPGAADYIDSVDAEARTFVFLAGETRVADSKDRPLDFVEANISEPARFVQQSLRPGDHFILISTAGALFDGTFEITVRSPYCPKNFYGATKAAEEMVLEKLVKMRGGEFSVIRLTNVFGRYSDKKKSAIHAFTRAVIAGDTVTLNGDGRQTRDFVYAGDVGFGVATLGEKARRGEATAPINMIGGGRSISLLDVVAAIEKAAGKPLKYNQIAADDLISTEPRDVVASPTDIRALLGDSLTPFEEGVRRTYEYYLNRLEQAAKDHS